VPRGRSRNGNGRQTLIDAAIANFTRLGYHGTSMRDIAGESGVTVASIYHHFPSKQAMLVEIMTHTMGDVIGATRGALDACGDDPQERLRALVAAWILFHAERQGEALIGASELRSLEDDGRAQVVALRDEQQAMFVEVVEAGVAQGQFATPYPREAARAIINMGRAVATWYRPDGGASPQDLAERYVELALASVRGPVPAPAKRTRKRAAATAGR
jgi:AcrR family transcriptional regulator